MQRLSGKVAIVTGASRGIGRHLAEAYAREGAAVALVARSAEQLREVRDEIVRLGGRAIAIAADVSDRAAVEAAVTATEQELGPIDILVNNAGVDRPFGPVGVADPDEWWRAQEIHVRGPLLFMSAAIPLMRQRGVGRIINVASSAAVIVAPGSSSYCVGKATLVRLTEHVAAENGDLGLAVFAVHPGTIMTEMGKAAIADPVVQKYAAPLVEHLRAYKDVDPTPALNKLADQLIALAAGTHDDLSGRYLDLDHELTPPATSAA